MNSKPLTFFAMDIRKHKGAVHSRDLLQEATNHAQVWNTSCNAKLFFREIK
jgi:hypothetical protein